MNIVADILYIVNRHLRYRKINLDKATKGNKEENDLNYVGYIILLSTPIDTNKKM